MKTYTDAEVAWQRARDLAREGDTAGAAELVLEVAAFYERGRFLGRELLARRSTGSSRYSTQATARPGWSGPRSTTSSSGPASTVGWSACSTDECRQGCAVPDIMNETSTPLRELPRDQQYDEAKRRLDDLAAWFGDLWVKSGETPLHNLAEGNKAGATYLEQNEAIARRAIAMT